MIVSYYSYKGGVGRSQLCANIATYLCRHKKKRVLLWDWDFEAPGLHFFFGNKTSDIQKNGTLELLEDYVKTMRKQVEVTPDDLVYISIENIVKLKESSDNKGCIDLLPAGNYNNDFSYRANSFDWFEFYTMLDGESYIDLLKKRLIDLEYDYILIDSRTGISDYSGICNIQLPDIVVMVIGATMQNFDGCKSIIGKIQAANYFKYHEHQPQILPILSRVDISGPNYNEWADRFNEYFYELILNLDTKLDREFVKEIFSDIYYKDTLLAYTSAISAGENIFTGDNQVTKTNFNRLYLNIAEFIEELNEKKAIDFYKKIDESTWLEYANVAYSNDEYRKASLAYMQTGIKQKNKDEKIFYFEKAVICDPTNIEAKNYLSLYIDLHELDLISPLSIESNPNSWQSTVAHNEQITPIKKSLLFYFTITITVVAVVLGFIVRKNTRDAASVEQQIDVIKKGNLSVVLNDTSYFNIPVINGSPYFDSIRKLGGPIGIDISKRNQIYDRSKMKQLGLSFVLVKATEGASFQDANFFNNWIVIKKSRFIRGAYHYFTTKASGTVQADNFIKNVRLEENDLPPIVNFYALGNSKVLSKENYKNMINLIDRIGIFYGAKPIVYLSNSLAELFLDKSERNKYYIWIDQSDKGILRPNIKPELAKWNFWQFTSKEFIDGIITLPDVNKKRFVSVSLFNGSGKELLAMRLAKSPGRRALTKAYDYLTNKTELLPFNNSMNNKDQNKGMKAFTKTGQSKMTLRASFDKYFNWNVELVNHSFSKLNKPGFYGKSMQQFLDTLKTQNFLNTKRNIRIGDVVFYAFKSGEAQTTMKLKDKVQACGIVYNFDDEHIYTIEAADSLGNKSIRKVRRFRLDLKAVAHIN